jgi:hypothetical protein
MESLAKHRSEATVYLGRQPIYGANREIRAYELLHRRAAGDTSARFRWIACWPTKPAPGLPDRLPAPNRCRKLSGMRPNMPAS